MTVGPVYIPQVFVKPVEIKLLAVAGVGCDAFTDKEKTWTTPRDVFYFYAEESFSDQIYDDEITFDCETEEEEKALLKEVKALYPEEGAIMVESIFQTILKRWQATESDTAPKYLYYQGCYTCNKLRMDEFGGFACFITADEVRYETTFGWLEQQINELQTGDQEL
jgi:hypothetical protein